MRAAGIRWAACRVATSGRCANHWVEVEPGGDGQQQGNSQKAEGIHNGRSFESRARIVKEKQRAALASPSPRWGGETMIANEVIDAANLRRTSSNLVSRREIKPANI